MASAPRLNPEQELLVIQHLKFAKRVAVRVGQKHPRYAQEIESAAYLGLVKAALRFDAELGYQFWTYAKRCIRGAIKDALVREIPHGFRENPEGAPYFTSLSGDGCGLEECGRVLGASPDGDVDEELRSIDDFEARIAAVPGHYKELLRLLFLRDLTLTRASRVLGIPRALARLWFNNAIRQLGAAAPRKYRNPHAMRVRAG